jgi:hypothetical protein
MLGALGDSADGRFKIQFRGVNFDFFFGMYGTKTRNGMGGVGDTELAEKGGRGKAGVVVGEVCDERVRNGTEQVADQTVEFRIRDEMSRLLLAKSSAKDSRKTEHGRAPAGQATGPAAGTDQFALDAKRGGLKWNEINVFEGAAIHRLAKHDLRFLAKFARLTSVANLKRDQGT